MHYQKYLKRGILHAATITISSIAVMGQTIQPGESPSTPTSSINPITDDNASTPGPSSSSVSDNPHNNTSLLTLSDPYTFTYKSYAFEFYAFTPRTVPYQRALNFIANALDSEHQQSMESTSGVAPGHSWTYKEHDLEVNVYRNNLIYDTVGDILFGVRKFIEAWKPDPEVRGATITVLRDSPRRPIDTVGSFGPVGVADPAMVGEVVS